MPIFRIPVDALDNPALKAPERLAAYVRLCRGVAQRSGIYAARGVPMDLRAGQWVYGYDELALLWGCHRDAARRTVAAFERAGLLVRGDAAAVQVAGEPPPLGTLYQVVGAERPRGDVPG